MGVPKIKGQAFFLIPNSHLSEEDGVYGQEVTQSGQLWRQGIFFAPSAEGGGQLPLQF